ncbi:signal peptidase complex subunit spc2 [Lodderomyces elongisporus]|uniref:signal peptidase complex subunit spc2 n=1 Tax=Lodderomyces elongisporus TaxID=36914 RepID=UPI002920CDB8|nr:signal peptidase complex subunit spc2 [Lodderomyces elongisporus]WLF80225.1 signal peptidase complex subunit spc2 [Lodderomyces elongisporus]
MSLKKANINSVKDLHKHTDEQLGSILQQLGYEESFTLTDIKLGLGLVSVAIAGLLFLADKKYEFKDIYGLTAASCFIYAILNGVLFLVNRKYKNVKYIGYSKGNKLVIATETTKYDPIYFLTINGKRAQIPFSKIYDSIGYLDRDEFSKLLSREINKKDE